MLRNVKGLGLKDVIKKGLDICICRCRHHIKVPPDLCMYVGMIRFDGDSNI